MAVKISLTNCFSKENSPKDRKGKRLYGHLVFCGRWDHGHNHEAPRLPEDDPGYRKRVHFGGVRKGPFQAGPELHRGWPSDRRIFPDPRCPAGGRLRRSGQRRG